MNIRAVSLFTAIVAVSATYADEELDIARQALRDGVWAVARNHALRSAEEEGRLLVLEMLFHFPLTMSPARPHIALLSM